MTDDTGHSFAADDFEGFEDDENLVLAGEVAQDPIETEETRLGDVEQDDEENEIFNETLAEIQRTELNAYEDEYTISAEDLADVPSFSGDPSNIAAVQHANSRSKYIPRETQTVLRPGKVVGEVIARNVHLPSKNAGPTWLPSSECSV